MTVFVDRRQAEAHVVLADDRWHIDDETRARIRCDDGVRYASLSSPALRTRFESSRAAAYLALERLGIADARLAPSSGRRAPQVAWPEAVSLSISHTSGIVAAAACTEGAIGVDIEHSDRQLNDEGFVAAFCTAKEREQLKPWSREQCCRILIDLWTAKEALTKSWGVGLAHDFRLLHLGIDGRGQVSSTGVQFFTFRGWRVCTARADRRQEGQP